MIWWLWTAYRPAKVRVFDVNEQWEWLEEDEPDVYWLGECAWTARQDTMGVGLR